MPAAVGTSGRQRCEAEGGPAQPPFLHYALFDAGSTYVRLLLAEKGLAVGLKREKPWERPAHILRHSPDGRLPVLVDGAHALVDAVAIGEYVEERNPEPPLLPAEAAARCEVRRLVQWFLVKCVAEVTRIVIGERFLKRFLRLGEPDSTALRAAQHNLKTHLAYIGHLAEHRHYLAGRRYTLADAAAAANVLVLDYFGDIDWARHDAAREWYLRVKSRRAVRSLLGEQVPGLPPAAHYAKLDF